MSRTNVQASWFLKFLSWTIQSLTSKNTRGETRS